MRHDIRAKHGRVKSGTVTQTRTLSLSNRNARQNNAAIILLSADHLDGHDRSDAGSDGGAGEDQGSPPPATLVRA